MYTNHPPVPKTTAQPGDLMILRLAAGDYTVFIDLAQTYERAPKATKAPNS